MITFDYRPRLNIVRAKAVFFAPKITPEPPGYDVVYYYSCQQFISGAQEFTSIIIDLAADPDELIKTFRKSTRKDIKTALSNPNLHFEIKENPSDAEVNSFMKAYNDFAEKKKLSVCNRNLVINLHALDKLLIADAIYRDETLCQFALINDEERLVSLYGYNTRLDDAANKDKARLSSHANKALDYHSMIHAKRTGKKYYDLYGLTLDENNHSAANVDHYKLGFRGQIVTEYNIVKSYTMKGSLFCLLRKLYAVYYSARKRSKGLKV